MTDKAITVEEVAALEVAEHILIDIRDAQSWAKGIPMDAIMMNAEDVKAQSQSLKKQYNQILIVCYQGSTSSQLAAELGEPFQSVSGGFKAWVSAGLGITIPQIKPTVNRYDRQLKLAGFGVVGQRKLQQAHVMVVGAGGLGAPAATYLAAAGVGELTLVDADEVALHNLHRQVLYQEADVQSAKVDAAKTHLTALNAASKINVLKEYLTKDNVSDLMAKADLIVDGTDNITTRYLINDWSLELGKPWIYAAVSGFNVQVSVFTGNKSDACYRCMFGDLNMEGIGNCNDVGILGPIPGVAAMIQVTEAIKVLCGLGTPLKQKMLSYDLLHQQFKMLKYPANSKRCYQHPEKHE